MGTWGVETAHVHVDLYCYRPRAYLDSIASSSPHARLAPGGGVKGASTLALGRRARRVKTKFV